MIIRFLLFALLISACTPNASTESNDNGNNETNTSDAQVEHQGSSSESALANSLLQRFEKAVVLSAEQKSEIVALIGQYGLEKLSEPGEGRDELRETILNDVFSPEQTAAWLEYRRKSKRAPVVIE